MTIDQRAIQEVLFEGLDDWVPVDQLIYLVWETHEDDPSGYQTHFKETLHYMVSFPLVQVGEIGNEGYSPWPNDTDQIVEKVIQGLDDLEWRPMGGFCWLANTPEGDERARLAPPPE